VIGGARLGALTRLSDGAVSSGHHRSPTPGGPPETSDVWETFFQLGDMLAATDTLERETLTAAVLAMCR
jgi:hypothetical protein